MRSANEKLFFIPTVTSTVPALFSFLCDVFFGVISPSFSIYFFADFNSEPESGSAAMDLSVVTAICFIVSFNPSWFT